MVWDYKTSPKTNYVHLSENPTQFGQVVMYNLGIFGRYVISPFYPSFYRRKTHKAYWTMLWAVSSEQQ